MRNKVPQFKVLISLIFFAVFAISGTYLSLKTLPYYWNASTPQQKAPRKNYVEVDGLRFFYHGFTYLWELPSEQINNITSSQLWHSRDEFSFSKASYPIEKVSVANKNLAASILTIGPKNAISQFLCNLKVNSSCTSYQVADVVDTFWHICPIYAGYQSRIKVRYQLHDDFRSNIESIGMPFVTLEAIRKDRHQTYLMTQPGKEPYNIQAQVYDDGYLRENLLNVAANKIEGWEYISWIDAHHIFENPYWWEESIVKMEKSASVQLFQRFNGFTKNNHTQVDWLGAIYKSLIQSNLDIGYLGFYGNAYGIRREVYKKIEYVFDRCIGGCCDCAYVKASLPKHYKFNYFRRWWKYTNQMDDWIEKTAKVFQESRTVVRGTAFHVPHEETFPYLTILGMFNESDFTIQEHLKKDENGTLWLDHPSLKRKVEFWVFLYSFAVPLYVIGISSGVIAAGLCVYLYIRRRKAQQERSRHLHRES